MLKLSKYLLLALLVPSLAFAQALPIRNDTPTTLRDLGANLNVGRNFAVDEYGRLIPAPVTAASLSEVTPVPMVIFQATAAPTAAPTPQYEANGDKTNFVENTTNQEVQIFLKGSQTPYHRVQPGSIWFEDWSANGQKLTGGIAVGRTGTLPTTGSIAIGGTR